MFSKQNPQSTAAPQQEKGSFFGKGSSSEPFFPKMIVQPKLTFGAPGDKYEQEADAVAEKVVRQHNLASVGTPPPVQPSAKDTEEKEQTGLGIEEEIQMKARGGIGSKEVSQEMEASLTQQQGNGQSLPNGIQRSMEQGIGADFSSVRLHTGSESVQMNEEIGAKAFTHGSDIFFNQNQYSPHTDEGQKLLAHELTHTVQQGSAHSIQRELAVAEPVPDAEEPVLTEVQIADAIRFNNLTFRNVDEISLIRDVVGVDPEPAVFDEETIQAIADYQAGQGLGADGKIGPSTSSRLSRELRAESEIFDSTDPERATLRREARRLDLRSMTIRVTLAGTNLSTRGSADYKVVFKVPDPTANGWIIQHHTRRANIQDGAGNAVAALNGNNEYWEGWQVVNGVVQAGTAANGPAPNNLSDQYRTRNEAAGTRGTIRLMGRVTFMPNFVFRPADWAITAVGVHPAGILPHRNNAPSGWADGFARQHDMTITYDDSVAPPTQNVTTTP